MFESYSNVFYFYLYEHQYSVFWKYINRKQETS